MDKSLTDKEKAEEKTRKDAPSATKPAEGTALSASQDSPVPGHDLGKDPIGAYSQAATRPLITQKAWSERNQHATWMDDPKSRLAIRLFSRGVMGAAFFTAGGAIAKKWMNGYDPTKSFANQPNKNPLSFIAKLVDVGVGKPIEAAVGAVAGKEAGLSAVRFRPTRYGRITKELRGRSLGDEVVNITFDFFCASIGDAWGRDIAGWFDPDVKKAWTDEKGNINIPKAVETALKSTARYLTYNGGEDWAVSIPYAYFMKGQRALINRASPGFSYDFDRGMNGGSFKVRNGTITGNYNVEGMIDLQNRFTAYNIGTLMYREAYDYIGNRLSGKPTKLYGAPDATDQHKGVLEQAGDIVKWAARSAVKGLVIMTPAVPFFWITRTPQSKHKGAFIDPKNGILAISPDHEVITADAHLRSSTQPLEYLKYENKPWPGKGNLDRISVTPHGSIDTFLPGLAEHHPTEQRNNFNAYGATFGIVDKGLNKIGHTNFKAAHLMDKPAAWADHNLGQFGGKLKKSLGIMDFNSFTRPMIYASASYTPYMYAKAEFANLWDNGKMDMAAERMVDGAAKLNWGEFKAGLGEVWNTVLYKPLADPAREQEGLRRQELDTSPPDIFVKTQAQAEHAIEESIRREQAEKQAAGSKETPAAKKPELSWQERVISGPPAYKQEAGARPEPVKPPKTHAEQEAMRKALEEITPPTNSIN